LHLLAQGPLCVCHFQTIQKAPQVAISKHLAYLREHGLVEAERHEQWMIYRLKQPRSNEFDLQLKCLEDCARSNPMFQADLKQQKKLRCECDWIVAEPRRRKRG
jgi:ArsR family transcriptional regulator